MLEKNDRVEVKTGVFAYRQAIVRYVSPTGMFIHVDVLNSIKSVPMLSASVKFVKKG